MREFSVWRQVLNLKRCLRRLHVWAALLTLVHLAHMWSAVCRELDGTWLQLREGAAVCVWCFGEWHSRAVPAANSTGTSCWSCPSRADRTSYPAAGELPACILMRAPTSLPSFPFRQCYLQPQFWGWPLVLVVTRRQNKTKPNRLPLWYWE